ASRAAPEHNANTSCGDPADQQSAIVSEAGDGAVGHILEFMAFDSYRIVLTAALLAAGCSRSAEPSRWPAGTIVDLSHDYSDQTIFWPTAESFRLEKVADGVTPQGYYYAANNFAAAAHGGTHIDAPVHFANGHYAGHPSPLARPLSHRVLTDVTPPSARQQY